MLFVFYRIIIGWLVAYLNCTLPLPLASKIDDIIQSRSTT